MGKIILIIVAVVIIFVAIYYGRFLFTKKVVREELPTQMQVNLKTLKAGAFRDIDFIHKGSGQAKILEDQTGHQMLRLENLRVTNGPDLYVYLSPNSEVTKDKASLGKFVSLGQLKGNVGDQNYDIPTEVANKIDDYQSVVVWCQQFGVLFTFAALK